MLKKGILFIPLILGLGIVLLASSFNIFNMNAILSSSHTVAAHVSSYFVYPFLAMQNKLVNPIKHWWHHHYTIQDLHATIAQLQEERDTLYAEMVEARAATIYAHDTQEVRAFKERYEHDAHIAHIMTKHFSDQAHYYLVHAGAKDGIHKDMVAVYKNCLVGRVTEVYPWYSKVLLITDAHCKVGACCGTSRALGIHRGNNTHDTTLMHYVSHLDSVMVGDVVLSSGEGHVFPQGFSLGEIATCTQDGLYQKITIKPSIDLRLLRYCSLLDKATL